MRSYDVGAEEDPREEGKMEEVLALFPILQGWERAGSEPSGERSKKHQGEEGGLMLGSAKGPLDSPSGGLAHGMQSLPCSFDQFLWQMLISCLLIPPWIPGT